MSLKNKTFLILIAIVDFLIVRLSLSWAIELRGATSVHGPAWTDAMALNEFIALLIISLCVSLLFANYGLYRMRTMRTPASQIGIIVVVILYTIAGLSILAFFVRSQWVIDSRLAVLYFAAISITLLVFFHSAILYPLYGMFIRTSVLSRRAMLIGGGPIAQSIMQKTDNQKYDDITFVGSVVVSVDTNESTAKEDDRVPVLGSYEQIPSIIASHRIDEAVITVQESSQEEVLTIIDHCRQTQVTIVIVSPLMELIYNKIEIETYCDIPAVILPDFPFKRLMQFAKRSMDILLSVLAIVIGCIPMLLIALLIKSTSRGPVIYRQIRVGKNGSQFVMYKFRTMTDDAHANDHHNPLESGDWRPIPVGSRKTVEGKSITPVGKFLRKTSLDELPQLYNVIRGEMSLVGPRPAMVNEFKQYDQWHKRRLSVLPGCTGLWQVSSRSEGDFHHMVLLDLYYINNASLLFDLRLLLKTVPVMLFGKGGK